MRKQQIYPKTKRIGLIDNIQITEKLDGSNLGIGLYNGMLYVFTRNRIYNEVELDLYKDMLYKGLYNYILQHKERIKRILNDNTIIFGEWLGMGNIKYDTVFKEFNVFAEAKLLFNHSIDKFELSHLNYNLDNIHYAFVNEEFPYEIWDTVPIVQHNLDNINKDSLDILYDDYCSKQNRKVEGFVIVNKNFNIPEKYVRYKNGKLTEHSIK